MASIRVRIAPSPTGIPHIGNTRTALFNYVFAKHHKGDFILRIEDTDQARLVAGAEEAIKEILSWLGLTLDETYKQSERLSLYRRFAEELLDKKLARKDEGAVRFIVPKGMTVAWDDAIGNKKITFESADIEDFVILKSDGFPTYHLANVVDDHEMNISHVIRGDEWISSTPKHILLYEAFGWELPVFVHLPLILGPDKTKLSKRHGAESVLEYRKKGYLKEAIINFLMLLGWTHPAQKEIFSLDEAIKLFDLKDVNTNAPVFDVNKLLWLNGHYIRSLSEKGLFARIKDKGLRMNDEKLARRILSLAQSRMKTLLDFDALVGPWFEKISWELADDEKAVAKDLTSALSSVDSWKQDRILGVLKNVTSEQKISMKTVYRIFTGSEQGLPVADMLAILGKEKTLARLKRVA